MPIEIQNETHWRDDDILRLVKEAAKAAEAIDLVGRVAVRWSSRWRVDTRNRSRREIEVEVCLPKRGPREDHPIPLISLASASIGSDTLVLPSQVTYEVANCLATRLGLVVHGALCDPSLYDAEWSNMPPSWCPDLIIRKNPDLTEDGTYKDFVKKREKEIASADRAIEKWEAKRDAAQRRVDTAIEKRRKAKLALASAKKRRQT